MRNRVNQIYENYWNYTAAFTDFDGVKFREVLRCVVNFIDTHKEPYSADKYTALQLTLQDEVPCNGRDMTTSLPSQRKRINQLVKLGFIRPELKGYPSETLEFLEAKTSRKRTSVLSKIVYKYANLLNAISNDIHTRQMAFFIRSLEELGSCDDIQLATLMTIDLSSFKKEYASAEDLAQQYEAMDVEGFRSRKYNQIGHLKNLLGKLEDLVVHEGTIYFKTDADRLFATEENRRAVRDPYLQRIYKSELEEESRMHYGDKSPRCMLDGLPHPVLIASHIKPYSHCADGSKDQFDLNNGLLLNKSLDSLFDLGYITFDDDGNVVASSSLDADMHTYLKQFKLHENLMNADRMAYMEYHHKNVFEKRFSKGNTH